jgi:hypothetical protein
VFKGCWVAMVSPASDTIVGTANLVQEIGGRVAISWQAGHGLVGEA